MALIIEVVNGDGSLQSVSLHVKVRALEVLQAIARRNKISNADTASYALYSWTLAVTRERATGIERANIVTLDELGPDDRPLMVRSALRARQDEILDSASEANAPGTDTRLEFGFGFLHKDEVARFRDEGPLIIFEAWQNNPRASRRRGNDGAGEGSSGSFSSTLSSAGTSASNPTASLMSPSAGSSQGSDFVANGKPRNEFLPINTIGRGDKHGYLFQRSAANPREWQRRWCVLRKDDVVHCLSNLDHSDAHVIKLLQTRVKAINPRELGGLKHCFEIDTPKDVVQFRSKTQDEAQAWIDAISRNISLAADNENFRLAERMIEDGQRAQCIRDEAVLERAMESLEGLLSTHAGADRLFRFAKRAALGARSQRNADLVAFSVDLDRAHAAFSAIPVDERDHAAMISPSHVLGIAPPLSRATARPSARGLFSGASVTSSSGSSTTGPLRGSAAALSRKDWILQICNRFLGLFGEATDNGPTDSKLSSSEVSSINAVRARAEDLRRLLADESSNTFSRDACIQLIEGARTVVLADMREKLYQEFLASPEYESVVATIPSRLRDR